MLSQQRWVRVRLPHGLALSLVAVSQPQAASADTSLIPQVTRNAKTGDQEIYMWDTKAEVGFKLVSLTADDLMNFASVPKGTTIQFPVWYNRDSMSLMYKGDGRFVGAYQGVSFAFERSEAAGIV